MKPLLAVLLIIPSSTLACTEYGLMRDALRFNGYALEAWGLNDAGNMEELWMMEDGAWVVVETTPSRCSTVISRPSEPMGRLSTPTDDADPLSLGRLEEGEPL